MGQALDVDVLHDPGGVMPQKGDVAVVVCGEHPYAETNGDACFFSTLFPVKDKELLIRVKNCSPSRKVVLVLFCGRPLPLTQDVLECADAILVCWLPGTEGHGIADVLCGHPPSGKLSVNWPDETMEEHQFRRGYGLTW